MVFDDLPIYFIIECYASMQDCDAVVSKWSSRLRRGQYLNFVDNFSKITEYNNLSVGRGLQSTFAQVCKSIWMVRLHCAA
jgi:hypothetical protein